MTASSKSGSSSFHHNAESSEPAPDKPIRILIADDHAVVRKGLRGFLAQNEHLLVVGEAIDGMEVLAKAKELSPDLVLMDISMPKLDGLAAARCLHYDHPRIKVLILTAHNTAQYAQEIIQSGATGLLSKSAAPEKLIQVIESVALGDNYLPFETSEARPKNDKVLGSKPMSSREREVLIAIAEGLSNKEISTRLNCGVRTIETHRERIMRKLNIHSVALLTRFAIAEGLVAFPKSKTQ